MRTKAALILAATVGGTLLTLAPPASAYCDPVLSSIFGGCTNACKEISRATGRPMNCPQ